MDAKDLIKLKEKIEATKISKARSEGVLEELNNKLRQEFGVSTLKEAEDLLDETEREIKQGEQQIEEQLADMRERYDL